MAGGWWLQTRASAQSLDAAGAAGPALGWSAWVLFALLLAGSGLISASETALFSLDKLDLLRLRGSTRWTDRSILMLLLRPNDTLITILILNNLINITASLTAGALMEDVLGGAGALAFGGAALLATTGILVVGEILPKTVGHLHPQRAARLLAPGLAATDWVLTPVRRTLGIFLKALLRFLRLPMVAAGDEVTEEELKVMIKSGEFSSVLEQDEREMIDGVFDLRQTIVAEIFNPRMAMVALPDDLTQQEMIARLRESPHNRVPIYHENLDHLMGFILTKEVLLDERGLWRDHLREALCVPERIGLLDLLKTFRKQRTKIAIVVDEYGGVAGMVTLQDLLEEIVGDIYEKHEPRQQEIAALEGDNWRVAGSMPLEEAGERLGVRFPEHKGRTIGGFVMNTLGRVPSPGDTVEFENLSLKVEKMATRRVQTLLVTAPAPVAGPTAAPTPDAGDGRPG
jgi:CBS domain containing-hemolysin-like protein